MSPQGRLMIALFLQLLFPFLLKLPGTSGRKVTCGCITLGDIQPAFFELRGTAPLKPSQGLNGPPCGLWSGVL